ncbi:hypothetical protein AQUCO_00300903v1 [Aquilegia coerulea]|uniref:Uncharacterized protein n=1 Tax=Aquilegia coerulea TaxID=218851 RepID=A0A2G5F128_AQUCA|nr:hypothetical protein AQUCO_00300903v1 [Aquilegia coerulea]
MKKSTTEKTCVLTVLQTKPLRYVCVFARHSKRSTTDVLPETVLHMKSVTVHKVNVLQQEIYTTMGDVLHFI